MNNTRPKSNRTVDRALLILELVAAHARDGITLTEISRSLDIPKSTASTILVSLVAKGFLLHNRREKRYYIGDALFNLGNQFVDTSNILLSIERIMERMAEESGYASFFAVLSGNEVRYLLRKASSTQNETPAFPQFALKASCTGVGKSLLLDYTKGELKTLFPSPMPKITAHTITDVDELDTNLSLMRPRDITSEREESSLNVQCRATPIRYNTNIVAAISISFPLWIVDEAVIGTIEQILLEGRNQIEQVIKQNPQSWIYSSLE